MSNSGCWYCKGLDGEDLAFSWEFDTYVHHSYLKNHAENPNDTEAQIMASELFDE